MAPTRIPIIPPNAASLKEVPENMSDDMAMLTEPVAVVTHALRQGGVGKSSNVVVIGAGTIGHLAAELSHRLGARVMVAESLEKRAKIVKSAGADTVFSGPMDQLKEAITEEFGEAGADVLIISRAVAKDLDIILHQMTEGATVVIVGNYKEPATVDWTLIERREITVKGAFRYLRKDFEQAASYLERGLVDPGKTITYHYHFSDIADAFALADSNYKDVLKVAIEF